MDAVTLKELESYDPQPVRQGTRARYLCPLSPMCRDKARNNAHRSLSVDTYSGVFYCHRCGEKGKLREFWEERAPKESFQKQLRPRPSAYLVARAMRPGNVTPIVPDKKTDVEALHEKMTQVERSFNLSAGEKYLINRGVPARVARAASCGFAPTWEHWEKRNDEWHLTGKDRRVVFPVRDEEQNVVAMHTRAIDHDHIHSAKITKGNKSSGVFYSSPDVFDSPIVAICEGPVDALALQTCGIPAVAMIGTTAPKWLAKRLRGKAVLIATDADTAGDEAAVKLAVSLRGYAADLYRLRPRNGKDWGEELEKLGAKQNRENLVPFAPETDDVTRANAAWQCALEDDFAGAEFVAKQISDIELMKALIALIRKESMAMAA